MVFQIYWKANRRKEKEKRTFLYKKTKENDPKKKEKKIFVLQK